MAVLKVGDWVLDGDSIGRVIAVDLRYGGNEPMGFTLVEFYEPDSWRETIHQSELVKLDEELYPILSDSILTKEEL